MNRLPYLDYLRGCAAFTIMIYHFVLFTVGDPASDTFLKKAGIYGVSVFYVLSGLTLFHVNSGKMELTKSSLIQFFTKRFFRIFPLLWLATLLTLFFHSFPSYVVLFLNLTGLFGLVAPGAYIGTGVWSIGNELVFYLFFPLFIFLLKKNKPLFWVGSGILFVQYLSFAFVKLPQFPTMVEAWKTYINPMNQVFLFLCGILLGYLFNRQHIKQGHVVLMLGASLLVFAFYPVSGNAIHLITGVPRLVYTFLSVVIVFCAYKSTYPLPGLIARPLQVLGHISYALYLLHPLVLFTVQAVFKDQPLAIILSVSGMLSLLLSYLVYHYFELSFIRLGKQALKPDKAQQTA